MKQNKSSKTLNQINSAVRSKGLEPIKNELLEAHAEALDKILDLKILWSSDGGKQLISLLNQNCEGALNRLVNYSKNRPTLDELMVCVHEYSANVSLLSTLQQLKQEDIIREQVESISKSIYFV